MIDLKLNPNTLPEYDKEVLILGDFESESLDKFTCQVAKLYKTYSGEIVFCGLSDHFINLSDVTHWTNIP